MTTCHAQQDDRTVIKNQPFGWEDNEGKADAVPDEIQGMNEKETCSKC